MSVIIAVILIAIILCKIGSDRSKAAAYDAKKKETDDKISEWESLYVDKDLEKQLELCIADERNYDKVRAEVSEVLSKLEHWRFKLELDFPLNMGQIVGQSNHRQALEKLRENQAIALDIMLANRGKIAMMRATFGYKAYFLFGNRMLQEGAYEYANAILTILQQRGVPVKLCYRRRSGDDAYIWEGSLGYHGGGLPDEIYLPFDKSVLFKENPIPPMN